jgi:hypothetical protein
MILSELQCETMRGFSDYPNLDVIEPTNVKFDRACIAHADWDREDFFTFFPDLSHILFSLPFGSCNSHVRNPSSSQLHDLMNERHILDDPQAVFSPRFPQESHCEIGL